MQTSRSSAERVKSSLSAPIGLAARRSSVRPLRLARGSDSGVRSSTMSALSACNPAAMRQGSRGPKRLPRIAPTGKATMKAPLIEKPCSMPIRTAASAGVVVVSET
eukprot:6204315-Pleurochrysis_carterae.AAC.7